MESESIEPAAKSHDTAVFVPEAPPLLVEASGRTDRGRMRESNEDQFAVAELARILRVNQTSLSCPGERTDATRANLFVVADGMGGYTGGEIASRIAVHTVEESLLNSLKWFLGNHRGDQSEDVASTLQAAVEEANHRVHEVSDPKPELRRMGSTLTLAFQYGRELFVAHVGDSRAYLCRDRRLHRMTRDHTLYAERVRSGNLPSDTEEIARLRRTITNAVGGTQRGVHTDLIRVTLEEDDRLLLCTDGLTEMLSDEDIAAVLADNPQPDLACERLIAMANERGGKDNITVIVAEFWAEK
jgi:serine/threonine protein phosphatase PrpC